MALTETLSTWVRDSHPETKVFDNISNQSAFLADLVGGDSKSKMKDVTGENITWNAVLGDTDATQYGGEGYLIDLELSDVVDQCSVAVKDWTHPVMLSWNKIKKNMAGKTAAAGSKWLGDYLNERVAAAEREFGEFLGTSIWSAGAQTTNARGKARPNLNGMGEICVRDGTYANVTVANAPTWQANVLDVSSTTGGDWANLDFTGTAPTITELTSASTSNGVFYLPNLLDVVLTASQNGNRSVNRIYTNQFYFNMLHGLIREKQQVTTNQWGFKTFNYSGVPVVLDKLCPNGKIYCVNLDALRIGGVPGMKGTIGKFEKPLGDSSDFYSANIFYSGNMWITERRSCGAIVGLPTTKATS